MHNFLSNFNVTICSHVTYYPLLAVLTDAVIVLNSNQISMYIIQFDNRYYYYKELKEMIVLTYSTNSLTTLRSTGLFFLCTVLL